MYAPLSPVPSATLPSRPVTTQAAAVALPTPTLPAPVLAPTLPPQPAATQPATQGVGNFFSDLAGLIGRLFSGVAGFFKRLFNPASVATSVPNVPATLPSTSQSTGVPPVPQAPAMPQAPALPAAPIAPVAPPTQTVAAPAALTAAQQQICEQQGLLATADNYNAFMTDAQAIQNQNALGPGSNDPQSISELQQVLVGWGYPVSVDGQWDQATTNAVLQFKKDNGLYATYKMADGSQGVHPFIDQATKQAMIKKLQAQPVTAPNNATPAASSPAALTADQQQICQQQGLLATADNYNAFMTDAQAIQNQNALGPGSNDPQSISELQQVLAGWGYQVSVNGQWDQATTNAVLQFKKDNGLYATYKMADGSQGIHPFIDQATKQAMIKKLGG